MKALHRNDKSGMITIIGMAVMALAFAVRAAGSVGIVAWDLGSIFVDAILFAILYRKTVNCLISFVPHFLCNMPGFFPVPVLFA